MLRKGMTFLALVILLSAAQVACWGDGQSAPTVRVFADVEHTGKLIGPLAQAPKTARSFVIAVPLPANWTRRDLLPEPGKDREDPAGRLGRLRIEARKADATTVTIKGEGTDLFQLYRWTAAGWQREAAKTGTSWTLTTDKSGALEVGVGVVLPEARPGVEEPRWPGAFTVEVGTRVDDPKRLRIPCRVAPFLIPSSLDPAEELMVVSQAATGDAVKALEAFAARTKLKLYTHKAKPPCDQWMQDTIEPGLFTFPSGAKGGQARAVLSGLRLGFGKASAGLDQQIAERLREDGVVTVVPGVPRKNSRWIDWYGNLEVTPPHTDSRGRRFPYGRVLTGKQRQLAMHAGVMSFLKAQAVQWPPIVVDTSWLLIGHVDETVNFVPAKTRSGFKVLLPSPKAARDLLDSLLKKGLGELPVFEKSRRATTVRLLREQVAASKENLAIDETVAGIRKQLRKELNLEEADFVLLPVLFAYGMAVIPNAVNSVIVNGHVVAPAPRGPRQDGKDLFEEAIRGALAGCDVKVVFVESWRAYHQGGGEVHCGTNVFRRLREPAWWRQVN
jgi:protein-arginine deiminase